MIVAEGLVKRYDGLSALDMPHLSITRGESFGLVGNNGAGKTTFFSLVLDLIKPTAGRVLSGGAEVQGSEHWKPYTGAYLDEKFLIDFLTPAEYFGFVAGLYEIPGDPMKDFSAQFHDFLDGEIVAGKKLIRELSKGNQKKVGIAAALMARPDVLVLDEPFPHLDPTSVMRLKRLLLTLHEEGSVTLLVSSHDLSHVTDVCGRIAVLEKGSIVRDIQTDRTTLQQLEEYFAVRGESTRH